MISNFLQILQSAGSPLHFSGLFDPVSAERFVKVCHDAVDGIFSANFSVACILDFFFVFACLKQIAQKLFKECLFQGLGWPQILPNGPDFE